MSTSIYIYIYIHINDQEAISASFNTQPVSIFMNIPGEMVRICFIAIMYLVKIYDVTLHMGIAYIFTIHLVPSCTRI